MYCGHGPYGVFWPVINSDRLEDLHVCKLLICETLTHHHKLGSNLSALLQDVPLSF